MVSWHRMGLNPVTNMQAQSAMHRDRSQVGIFDGKSEFGGKDDRAARRIESYPPEGTGFSAGTLARKSKSGLKFFWIERIRFFCT